MRFKNVFLFYYFSKMEHILWALRNTMLFSCVEQNEWWRYAYREPDQPWSQRPVRHLQPIHHRQPAMVVQGRAVAGVPARSAP